MIAALSSPCKLRAVNMKSTHRLVDVLAHSAPLREHSRARPPCARRSPSTATTQKLHRCSLDLDGLEARGEVLLVRRRAPRRGEEVVDGAYERDFERHMARGLFPARTFEGVPVLVLLLHGRFDETVGPDQRVEVRELLGLCVRALRVDAPSELELARVERRSRRARASRARRRAPRRPRRGRGRRRRGPPPATRVGSSTRGTRRGRGRDARPRCGATSRAAAASGLPAARAAPDPGRGRRLPRAAAAAPRETRAASTAGRARNCTATCQT